MKANEFLQIFELGKAFKPPKAKRSGKKAAENVDFRDIDLSMLLHKKLQEADTLKRLLDDREKINKKEEKKEEKGWSLHHISYFLIATFPITAPAYVAYIRAMIH